MSALQLSADRKHLSLGQLAPLKILNKTQAANVQARATEPMDPRTEAILDSCGCSGASLLAPMPQGGSPSPSLASQLFNISWSHGWGVPSVSQSYIVAENLTPPEEYCCDVEIPTFTGGTICEQTTNFAVFAMEVDTCLLNQSQTCGPNGWEQALSVESAQSMLAAKSMQAYINRLAIDGLPSSGILGLRNTPGVQTYNIKNYASLTASAMAATLNGVWPLAADPFANMMFGSEQGANDWVMVGGPRIINYLRGMMLPGTTNSVLGTFTGSCPGVCQDLGLTMAPNQLILDASMDDPAEIYLIRRRAATLVVNLFDDNGTLSPNGSMIRTCAPTSANCLTATKLLFARYAGLLLESQNSIIRIRFN